MPQAACINTDVEARPTAAEIVERLQALVPSDHMSPASSRAASLGTQEPVASGGQLKRNPADGSGSSGTGGVSVDGPNRGASGPNSDGSAAAMV